MAGGLIRRNRREHVKSVLTTCATTVLISIITFVHWQQQLQFVGTTKKAMIGSTACPRLAWKVHGYQSIYAYDCTRKAFLNTQHAILLRLSHSHENCLTKHRNKTLNTIKHKQTINTCT